MASWQDDPDALAGHEEDIVYLVAMNENCDAGVPTASNLDRWQDELGFDAIMLTDPLREIYDAFVKANDCQPGMMGCSNAVTALIDKNMRIRHFGSTYACGRGDGNSCGNEGVENDPECIEQELDQILALLAE